MLMRASFTYPVPTYIPTYRHELVLHDTNVKTQLSSWYYVAGGDQCYDLILIKTEAFNLSYFTFT